MGIKEQIGQEKWKLLFNAPSAASAFVATASGSGLEVLKEMLSASKFIQEVARKDTGSGYGQVVDDFLAETKGMAPKEARELSIPFQSKSPDAIRTGLKKVVADGAAVAADLPGGDGFKRWLVDMARQVAETKTGGVLGIGGTAVIDEKEQAAIDELAEMLGV